MIVVWLVVLATCASVVRDVVNDARVRLLNIPSADVCGSFCEHYSCEVLREWSAHTCSACNQPIGYDRDFVEVCGSFGNFVCFRHTDCGKASPKSSIWQRIAAHFS
jgi:hypothetical protein